MIDSYKFCFMIYKLDLFDKISTLSFISFKLFNKIVNNSFLKMRQNNTWEQKNNQRNQVGLKEIQQATLSQKVFQLEVELHNKEKHYQCIKKPIKQFPKFKRSLHDSQSSERNFQVGVFSEKIISPSIGQNLQPSDKSSKPQIVKMKNIYDAYKQALELKYKKRMKQFQKSVLKINVSKIEENFTAGHQLIYERQSEIKKRLSNKKLDPSLISHLQNLSTSNRKEPIMKKFNPKKNTFLLKTLQQPEQYSSKQLQNKNSKEKYPFQYYDYLFSPAQQGNFYQIKRKCYTQEQLPDDEEIKNKNYNKTRNVSFRLPSQRIKTHKHFIQKIGGITYNLPQVLDKINSPNSNATISYLVKSLRKPSKSQNSKCQRQTISPLQDLRKFSQKQTKNKRKLANFKYYTQSIESSQEILDDSCNEYLQDLKSKEIQCNRLKPNKKSLKDEFKLNKNTKRKVKLNGIGDVQGWAVENQTHQGEHSLFATNRFQDKS